MNIGQLSGITPLTKQATPTWEDVMAAQPRVLSGASGPLGMIRQTATVSPTQRYLDALGNMNPKDPYAVAANAMKMPVQDLRDKAHLAGGEKEFAPWVVPTAVGAGVVGLAAYLNNERRKEEEARRARAARSY